jgi:hypothetical protein
LTIQEKQLEAQVDRQGEFASMVTSIEAFCQRVRAGLADATFEQKRALVELLIDRVLVDNGKVEIRYVIPRAPRGETTHFYQLRKDYFEMPLVAGPWPASTYLVGIILPELATPFTDRFIGDPDATGEQHLLDIAVAQGEAEVEPDGMRDNFRGKAVVFVAFWASGRRHVGGPSGSVMAHMWVDHRPIVPPAGRARNKLTKPEKCIQVE